MFGYLVKILSLSLTNARLVLCSRISLTIFAAVGKVVDKIMKMLFVHPGIFFPRWAAFEHEQFRSLYTHVHVCNLATTNDSVITLVNFLEISAMGSQLALSARDVDHLFCLTTSKWLHPLRGLYPHRSLSNCVVFGWQFGYSIVKKVDVIEFFVPGNQLDFSW